MGTDRYARVFTMTSWKEDKVWKYMYANIQKCQRWSLRDERSKKVKIVNYFKWFLFIISNDQLLQVSWPSKNVGQDRNDECDEHTLNTWILKASLAKDRYRNVPHCYFKWKFGSDNSLIRCDDVGSPTFVTNQYSLFFMIMCLFHDFFTDGM